MLVEPFIPFVLFVLALYATPGPATLSIAACGAAFGFRRSVPFVFGVVSGLVIIFVMVALGLGVLFTQYPTVHLIFKWVSFIYILYLAYKIATAPSIQSQRASRLGFLQGIPMALLNPKAYFAIIATVAQFAEQGEDYYASFVRLIVWAIAITTIMDLLWAYVGAVISSKLGPGKLASRINILFAVLLVASVLITMFLV